MNAGILSQITVGKETTWGTAVVPNKTIPVRPTGGLVIKKDIHMAYALAGRLQKNFDSTLGKSSYEGDYTMDAFADYIGYFLLSALGTDTPATHSGETIVFDHVFTETAPKPSLTIEQAIDVNCRRFAGVIASGFKISGKVGEFLEFTPMLTAKTQATSSEVTAAYSSVAAFNHAQLGVKIGGSLIGQVESFELEYKNGIDLVYALGSTEPQYTSIKSGSEVTGKMQLYLDSTTITELTNYINGTKRSLELIATGGSIGSAASYLLDISIPKAIYNAADSKITDSHNVLDVEWTGMYSSSDSKMLAVQLTNLISAY
jgi:hypothetical protein